MKLAARCLFRLRISAVILSAVLLAISFATRSPEISAHGGEDHGDKPKVETTGQGMVARTARLGAFEIMVKHPTLEPDTPVAARLFVTSFATNEPASNLVPSIQIESAGGAITEVEVQKTDSNGSFAFNFPPLPEGTYTIRVIAAVSGKTETATFSGVDVAHRETAKTSASGSWISIALMGLSFLIGAGLLAGMVYLGLRAIRNRPLHEEAVSA